MYNNNYVSFARTLGARDKQKRKQKMLTALGLGIGVGTLAGTAGILLLNKRKSKPLIPNIGKSTLTDRDFNDIKKEAIKESRRHLQETGVIAKPLSGKESAYRSLTKSERTQLVNNRVTKLRKMAGNRAHHLAKPNRGYSKTIPSQKRYERKLLADTSHMLARSKWKAEYSSNKLNNLISFARTVGARDKQKRKSRLIKLGLGATAVAGLGYLALKGKGSRISKPLVINNSSASSVSPVYKTISTPGVNPPSNGGQRVYDVMNTKDLDDLMLDVKKSASVDKVYDPLSHTLVDKSNLSLSDEWRLATRKFKADARGAYNSTVSNKYNSDPITPLSGKLAKDTLTKAERTQRLKQRRSFIRAEDRKLNSWRPDKKSNPLLINGKPKRGQLSKEKNSDRGSYVAYLGTRAAKKLGVNYSQNYYHLANFSTK